MREGDKLCGLQVAITEIAVLPAPIAIQPPTLPDLSPAALADLLILEVLARGHGTVALQPAGGTHLLSFDGGGDSTSLACVDSTLARATVSRLALIGDLGLSPPQVGRIAVALASHRGPNRAEILLAVRHTAAGVSAELHALARLDASDDTCSVAGIESLPTSETASPRYRVIREVGRGGMGIVYLARHTGLDKEVALKVLYPAMARRRAFAAQFVVEARAACRASHPAIVDVTDFGYLPDGRNYLVMEYVPWPTLASELRNGRLPLKRALAIALEIAHGLAAAHDHGVVHRDLKPANIFLSSDDRVKIGDFGLAQTVELDSSRDPLGDLVLGTVPYMAPEQIAGARTDQRVDLYAFGCILHELLTGATPYSGASTAAVLSQHQNAPAPRLHVADHALPERLVELSRVLLAKTAGDRPSSFQHVITVLLACQRELR